MMIIRACFKQSMAGKRDCMRIIKMLDACKATYGVTDDPRGIVIIAKFKNHEKGEAMDRYRKHICGDMRTRELKC